MQYVQRKLQWSVTEIRKSRTGRPSLSVTLISETSYAWRVYIFITVLFPQCPPHRRVQVESLKAHLSPSLLSMLTTENASTRRLTINRNGQGTSLCNGCEMCRPTRMLPLSSTIMRRIGHNRPGYRFEARRKLSHLGSGAQPPSPCYMRSIQIIRRCRT